MKHLFVPYELALLAKEKKFDEECFMDWKTPVALIRGTKQEIERDPDLYKANHYASGSDVKYINEVPAPLYQQLVDWFREKHKIEIYCLNYYRTTKGYKPEYECRVNGKQLSHEYSSSSSVDLYPTYYEALNAALTEAFKLI